MKKNLSAPLLIFALSACVQSLQPHNELVGIWKSNAEKTLQSMRSVEGLPEKSKRLLENNLFGHLVVEYREHEVRHCFDEDEHNYRSEQAAFRTAAYRPHLCEPLWAALDALLAKDAPQPAQ